MISLIQTLQDNPVAYALLVLCAVSAFGILLGSIGVRGIKLEISGALFAGILFAHFGITINDAMLNFAQDFGLIIFVYSIGIQVGPGFFSSLKKNGLLYNALATAIVFFGCLVVVIIHYLTLTPMPTLLGIFAGATTSTSSLAAAEQILKETATQANLEYILGASYAVAYPFGILGVLLAMLVIRSLLSVKPDDEARLFEEYHSTKATPFEDMSIVITNANFFGLELREIPGIATEEVVISRLLHNQQLSLADPDHIIAEGDIILAIGPKHKLKDLQRILGKKAETDLMQVPTDLRWERMVVTNAKILGKSLAELKFRTLHGITVSRLTRTGIELVPSGMLSLQFGDILTVIGTPEHITKVSAIIGNKDKLLQQTQIAPIFIGIILGILCGSLPFHIPGMPIAIKLGLAGGSLIVAILLSRLGHLGPLVWFMPPGVNQALREIGIVLFLACVGLRSGAYFFDTLIHGDGLKWMLYGACITFFPLVIVGLAARILWKMNYLTICGLLAGSMTSAAALAFSNSMTPNSEAQALAYASVYPLTMFLRVVAPQILILLFYL